MMTSPAMSAGAQQLGCNGGTRMEDLTAGNRTTAAAAAVILIAGVGVIVVGVVTNDFARSLGGACLTMPALTLFALVSIRRWVTNTAAERARLAQATREVEDERLRYVAAQAAQEQESARLRRDAAAEIQQAKARLDVERVAMEAEFEERRNALICKTINDTVVEIINGRLAPPAPTHGRVIDFPGQLADREQARERGVSRP